MEMGTNRLEIEVLDSRAALAAFARAWRQARTGRKTTPRIAFGSLGELFKGEQGRHDGSWIQPVFIIRNLMETAGMSRERYFELLGQ